MSDFTNKPDSGGQKITADDPRLTAYALGELENEQDRAAVEAAVKDDPELQATVDEIRDMVGLLDDAFAQEEVPEAGVSVEALEHDDEAPSSRRKLIPWPINWNRAGLALAACAVLALGLFTVTPSLDQMSGREENEQPVETVDTDGADELPEREVMITLNPPTVPSKDAEADWIPPAPPEPEEVVEALEAAQELREGSPENPIVLPPFHVTEGSTAYRSTVAETGAHDPSRFVQTPSANETLPEAIAGEGGEEKLGEIFQPPTWSAPVATQSQRKVAAAAPAESRAPEQSVAADQHIVALPEFHVTETATDTRQQVVEAGTRITAGSSLGDAEVAEHRNQQILGFRDTPADFNREAYDTIQENAFKLVSADPLSTFSIDVDTASFANVRRMLNRGQLPPAGAVRIEELINYFSYDYPVPESKEDPFAVHLEAAQAPWKPEHVLVRIGLKGYEMAWDERPPSKLVFLVDSSGSMNSANKLPLVQESLKLLAQKLDKRDRVALVTYAGSSRIALPSTTADNTETIMHAISGLGAGGSTHGSAGIRMAYEQAKQHFVEGGNNRVILCTDGDFNVGVTSRSELTSLIEEAAKSGVFLSIYGFGMGNYQDATLEELSNKGNGTYGYIDSLQEAKKVFIEEVAGSLFTIAKDVKIQVEFNPAQVKAYRLIGYENRMLAAQDFNDDKKDAGEIGAGHTVTALYEVVPMGVDIDVPSVDDLKYQKPAEVTSASEELLTVKLRYKQPDGDTSKLMEFPLQAEPKAFPDASQDFRFASAVAGFGMLLRESEYAGNLDWVKVGKIARDALGDDPLGRRLELVILAREAKKLKDAQPAPTSGVTPDTRD